MSQGKIDGGSPATSRLAPAPRATGAAKRDKAGASQRGEGPVDRLDKLPPLQQRAVGARGTSSPTAQMLVFPDGKRFVVGAELDSGSSKTARDAKSYGGIRRRHFVDLETVVREHAGLKGSMTHADVVKELALTRRYLDPNARAGTTVHGTALHAHLVVKRLPTSAQDAVRSAPPGQRGKVITKILRDVGRTLTAMHQDGNVHLDIKPDNIRLDKHGTAMLIDFNSVGDIHDPPSWRPGNPSFRAPAFLLGGTERTLEVDVHSLGVTGLSLLAGHKNSPFAGFRTVGTLEHLQPGLDALRQAPAAAFNDETLVKVAAGHSDLLDFLRRAYAAGPELTEVILRSMIGSAARPIQEVGEKLEALVRADQKPSLLGTLRRGLLPR